MSTRHDHIRPRGPTAPPPAPHAPPRLVVRLFRWVGQHVRGFHGAVGVLGLAGLGLILVCGAGFVALAEEVMEGDTQRMDEAVLLWMNSRASTRLTSLALDVTALGAGTLVFLVALVASVFLWVSRHRYSALLLWVSILGSWVINASLKLFFERPRPSLFPWRVPHAGLSSFPSGHSMGAMVCYATLAYLIARLVQSRFLRHFTIFVATAMIVAIGLSRMYLGVHYPTDVLAGFAMGLTWAAFCALMFEALRYFRHREPKVAAQEHDLDATAKEGPAEA
jgi:undecaprenyl-diphosphatase